jgi:diguanylate cyclase (GGDEF)-like protein
MLREQALRDPLTGLYNRRFLQEALEREVCRSVRRRAPIGIILLDLDHFKQLNDTFGHHAGDTLLRAVANLLQSRVRGGDVLCRYGGDEFSNILPDASLENTLHRAEELRQAVKLLRVQSGGSAIEPITISLGAAAYPDHGETLESLLRHADVGLYEAKAAGRDEVRMSERVKGHADDTSGS